MVKKYQRPFNTTSNQNWMHANSARDLVPFMDEDDKDADLFVKLAGKFLLTQGQEAGRRLEDVWLPWQKDALRLAFQSRESMWLLGKGSGKSLSAGAFALATCMFHALKGKHSRGLIVCLAPSIPTARVVFDHIMEAILADPELRPLFASNVQDRSLTHKESGIKIQVLACEMKAAVGRRPIALIIDELHEIGRLNEGLAVTNQLRQGGRNAGRDFKVLSISTMSTGEPRGEFARALKYATKVRDAEIDDPTFAPLLYTFPLKEREDLNPLDPAEWWRGMPSLRTEAQPGTMDAEELQKELTEAAAAEDAESFGLLLSQRLGIQKNIDAQNAESILHGRWLDAGKCSTAIPAMAPDDIWTIGVDAGGLDDPLAVALLVRKSDGTLEIRPHQFLTQEGYDRAHASTRAIYDQAIGFGTLHVRPTAESMDAAVHAKIRDVLNVNAWATIGGDEHGRAGFKARFEASVATFNSVPQTWVLGGSLANLEAALVDGRVKHPHCPLLNANVANLSIEETPNGNRRLGKKDGRLSGQGHAKIDGVMALLSGMHLQTEQETLVGDIGGMIG